jgi:hypothetical protein
MNKYINSLFILAFIKQLHILGRQKNFLISQFNPYKTSAMNAIKQDVLEGEGL